MAKDQKDNKKKGAPDKGGAPAGPEDLGPRTPPRLKVRFEQEIRPAIVAEFKLANVMEAPRLQKIVLNVNMGRHLEGNKIPAQIKETVLDTLKAVSGQRPVVLIAKKSVSNFKVREGAETAAMVTLRRERMWHFLDRLLNLATPRIKDFRGLSEKAFDKAGNYSLGLTEQGVFPEIDMAKATHTHGMHVNVVFSNSTPEMSRAMLTAMGMPFRKPGVN